MYHVTDKIAIQLVANGTINPEEKELYVYGLNQGIITMIGIFSTVLIGYFLGMVWQTLVFMITYLPLRMFAGGYHANTQKVCYTISVLLTIITLMAIRFIPVTSLGCIIMTLVAGLTIFLLAPVGDRNKPLDQLETMVYRKRTRRILLVEVMVSTVFLFVGLEHIVKCIVLSQFSLSVMLLLGGVKNRRLKIVE